MKGYEPGCSSVTSASSAAKAHVPVPAVLTISGSTPARAIASRAASSRSAVSRQRARRSVSEYTCCRWPSYACRPRTRRPWSEAAADASAPASAGMTPQRSWPMLTSTSASITSPAARAARAIVAAASASSTTVVTGARPASATRRATFSVPAISVVTSSGPIPASAMTSATPSFAQHIPIAPRSSWRRATSGDLCVFAWGRIALPVERENAAIRSRLRSKASRSMTSAGVSTSASGRPSSNGRSGDPQRFGGELQLHLDLLDLLVDDERAVSRVVPVLAVRRAEGPQPLGVHVDPAGRTARIVLPDEQEHRRADALDVRERIRSAIAVGRLDRCAAEERGVVALERLHLVLECRDVIADRDDADAGRPALRLHPEPEQRQVTAPGAAAEDAARRVREPGADRPVPHLCDVLELGQPGPADDGVAPRLAVPARPAIVDHHHGEAAIDPGLHRG